MKFKIISSIVISAFIAVSYLNAQRINPAITFNEFPETHNMHICSDGNYYYTVNGGKTDYGKIGKFTLNGKLIDHYSIELDMRGIMYKKKGKSLYVNCYDGNIYKIIDVANGSYELVYAELYPNSQSCLALDHKGKNLYAFDSGTLDIYDFSTGVKVNTIYGLKCGTDVKSGSTCVAIDQKHIYTWDGDLQQIFIYDKNGKMIKTVSISEGDYGFSLSSANGLIFVCKDGDYDEGTWYGYDIK